MKYSLALALTTAGALSVVGCAATPAPAAREYTIPQTSGGPNCRRLAQPGDTKIQIYCSEERPERAWLTSRKSCRSVSRITNGQILRFCGYAAEWEQFDTWAVTAGITCRWSPARRSQEFCMTSAQWKDFSFKNARTRMAVAGGNWSGGGGDSGGSGFGYASSYGYFPAGGAIGSTP